MPLLLKIIAIMLGGLYLVDQSQVLCSDNHCNVFSVTTAQQTPSTSAAEVSPLNANGINSKTRIEKSGFAPTDDKHSTIPSYILKDEEAITEGGIEGTGLIPADDKNSIEPSHIVKQAVDAEDNDNAVAEGGIEGSGIYDDFDENPIPFEHNPNDKQDSDEDGIEGTGIVADAENQLITYGPITQFGSIYVNGNKYEIDDAELEFVNGTGASELSIGMIVQVHADWQQQINGVFNARKVTFDHQIEGPINAITRHGDVTYLDILGTTVVVASDTAIDQSIPKYFNPGSVVTVSGINNAKDQLLATYITLRSEVYRAGQQVELESTVDAINEMDQIIRINGMDVDVSQARWKQGNFQTVDIDTIVEIIGQYDTDTNRIIANQVRIKKNGLSLNKGNKLNLDTIVTHYQSINQFRLNGYITNASNAEFLRGKPENLGNGVRIRATGNINIDGIFEVHTLRIKSDSNFVVKTQVNSVNSATGEIGFLNLNAFTQPDTVYQSKLKSPNKYFSIHDIEIGDWIEIQGVEEDNRLTISNLFALRNKKQMILKGHASKDRDDRLLLLGIEIQPEGQISPELVSSIRAGDMIVVKGTLFDGSTFYAREIILH